MKSIPQIFSIIFLLLIINYSSSAQEIWGMTEFGGKYNKGVIFKMDEKASDQQVVFSFESTGLPEGKMTEYNAGTFYGLTSSGGSHDYGIVYKFESATGGLTKIADFKGITNGKDGAGSMIMGNNGKFYGMTVTGGIYDHGTIFEFDPVTEELNKIFDFNESMHGSEPLGSLIEGENGNLYGLTSMGGEYNMGVLFVYNYTTNDFENLVDLNGQEFGAHPMGSLVKASDNYLYGLTRWGGESDYGVIFKFNPDSHEFNVVFEFDGVNSGRNPQGTLLEASNEKLYGTTAFGGVANNGLLFEYDFKLNEYNKKIEFLNTSVKISGSLVEGPYNKLYGIRNYAYTEDFLLLEYDFLEESLFFHSKIITGLRDYNGAQESLTVTSEGKLLYWGSDNFYIEQDVFLFEFDLEQKEYTNIHKNSSCFSGSYPQGNLVQAENGNLYATANRGGKYDGGIILEFTPVSNGFKKLINFDYDQKGAAPVGSLILYDDSLLYGMTNKGGANDLGVIFSYNTNSHSFIKLIDFNGPDNGRNPQGSLLLASNGFIYGMTTYGGVYDMGVLFELEPATGAFRKIIDFDYPGYGNNPYGSLFQASDGKLYGVTSSSFFEYEIETGTFRKLKDKGGIFGEPLEASNNHIYFTSNTLVYDFDPENQTLHPIEIPSAVGYIGKLLEYTPGKLIGMAYGEVAYHTGTENRGMIFEIELDSGISTVNTLLDGSNGRHPFNSGLTHVNIISNPVVQCKPVTIFLDANGNALLNPADVYDGTPVEGLDLLLDKNEFTCSDVGDNTVVLTVIDADGNESACSTIVSVADTLAPFITCAPDFTAFLNPFEEEYIIEGTDLNAVADDNCMTESLSFSINSGNIENATSLEGYKFGAGIHEVTWTATDNSNNVSVCSSVIKIEKRPTLVLVNKIELIEGQEIIYIEISLMDEILSEGIMGKTVHFSIQGVTASAVTNTEGIAFIEIPVADTGTETTTVNIFFEEDEVYTGYTTKPEVVTGNDNIAGTSIEVYPNPFSERLNFNFIATETTNARIDIYDPAGRLVQTIFNQPVYSGMAYRVEYTPQYENINHYLYRIKIGRNLYSGKVLYSY